ncbi:hypothetical protein ATERTT37_007353 [Aspergillus terreus]
MEFDNIDKKVLYKVMMDINPGHPRLDLDYGDIKGPDQYWLCEPGEEVSFTELSQWGSVK